MGLKVVFKLLSLGRENLFALSSLHRDLWVEVHCFTGTAHLFIQLDAGHAFLDHEGIHVNIGLETSSISGIGKTVVSEALLRFKVLLLLDKHIMEGLSIGSFQIELLLDGFDTRLILLQKDVELVDVHLTNGTVVVGDGRVDRSLGAHLLLHAGRL